MSKTLYTLALIALSAKLVQSWDFATGTSNRIEFYTGQSVTHKIEGVEHIYNITALAYDEIYNMQLFVDTQGDHASIVRYNQFCPNKFEILVTREKIEDIAFDPVKKILFFTDPKERSIYWISLEPEYKNKVGGNPLIDMHDGIPMAIAVDSCRGYIYWSNINLGRYTVEKARFDGTEREVVIVSNVYKIVSLAIDQRTRKIIWADDKNSKSYNVKSADLNGKNEMALVVGTYIQPKALAVTKDYVYMAAEKNIWQYKRQQKTVQSLVIPAKMPSGIITNYKIEEQVQGINECSTLKSLLRQNALTTLCSINENIEKFCVNGAKVKGESHCKCPPGYIGERCDVSVCQNYCIQGYCNVTAAGQPNCSCSTGYSGERCEVDVCHNYCQNNGFCILNELDEPVCGCHGNYEGSRCETAKDNISVSPIYNLEEQNLTLSDLVLNHPKAKIYVVVGEEST